MNPDNEQKDRLFWALCARAMQRAGQGFPSTDEEIKAYEAAYEPDLEERKRFGELLQRVLAEAQTELERGRNGTGHIGKRTVLERLTEFRMQQSLAAAARKNGTEPISPELAKDIERMIDESEHAEPEDTDEPDGQEDEETRPK